jgi:hypothetical protein
MVVGDRTMVGLANPTIGSFVVDTTRRHKITTRGGTKQIRGGLHMIAVWALG